MNYLDVYFSRVNHLGETTAERIRNGGIRSFEKWLAESPHTVKNLSVERGIYFDGIILTSKDKEYEKIMFLEVANDIPLFIGDIMNWEDDYGNIEKWIIIQEEKKVNGTFRSFWIIRCNYLLKWIDVNGHLQNSWAYFVSSLDSKIKGNFRTWNNLITPQPNKYAEVIMPQREIERSTNFIVEQESWSVVEYDHTSVPGVIYLSLTENKINLIYDDVEQNVADTDKLAQYALVMPEKTQIFKVGDVVSPQFTLTKNGVPSNSAITFLPTDKRKVKLVGTELIAQEEGSTKIIAQLVNVPDIRWEININIGDDTQEFSAYIKGNDNIHLGRTIEYTLIGLEELSSEVQCKIFMTQSKTEEELIEGELKFIYEEGEQKKYYTLVSDGFENNDTWIWNNCEEEANLAIIDKNITNGCLIRANAKNKLGKIILGMLYENKIYFKLISIIPLW